MNARQRLKRWIQREAAQAREETLREGVERLLWDFSPAEVIRAVEQYRWDRIPRGSVVGGETGRPQG